MILQPSVSFVKGSQHRVIWLSWLIVVGSLLAGCGSSSDLGQQEPTYVRQVIKLKTNSSLSTAPGSSNGYIVIGQLAEDSEAVPGMGGISLTAGAVERLFEDGSTHVYRQDGSETIDLFCHVVEGTWCYFVPQGQIEPYDGLYDPQIEDEARRVTSDVAEQLTKELGVETIAQSRNNGVKLRCARPEDALSQMTCRIDRGGGWQELPISP